jgi:hypothetical protein
MLEKILKCLANVLIRKNETFHNVLIIRIAVSISKTATEMFFFNFQMRFVCGVWEIHIIYLCSIRIILGILLLSDMTLHHWVIGSQYFKGTLWPNLKRYSGAWITDDPVAQ